MNSLKPLSGTTQKVAESLVESFGELYESLEESLGEPKAFRHRNLALGLSEDVR